MADKDVADYRPGSTEDFDRLYRASYPRLVRTLFAVLGDAAAAEDCAQETFVRAFRAWSRYRPEKPPEAWLHQIGLNVAISHRRWMRLREAGEVVRRLGRPGPEPDPAEQAASSDLVVALSRIAPRLSAVIVLRHYHGYTNRELAVALGVSERTIGQRLAQAGAQLRRILGPDWRDEVSALPTGGRTGVVISRMDAVRRPNE